MKMSKEEAQKKFEEKRALREKQMTQLKATNEMLNYVLDNAKKKFGENSEEYRNLEKQIKVAIDQNYERGEVFLNASKGEIESMNYNEPSEAGIAQYNDYLKKRGITDDSVLYEMSIPKEELDSYVDESEKGDDLMSKLKNKLKSLEETPLKNNNLKREDKISDGLITDFDEFVKEHKTKKQEFDTDYADMSQEQLSKLREEDVDYRNAPYAPIETHDHETDKEHIDIVGGFIRLPDEDMQIGSETFDPTSIDPTIQYEFVDLPSKGECYPLFEDKDGNKFRIKSLPVAYLTAADENLIQSPNLYNSGRIIDIILKRKILDKTIPVEKLCAGDRDAIIVWLRATAYDSRIPIVATNKKNGKTYNHKIDLSELNFRKFDLKGDENGYFEYVIDHGDGKPKDVFKFKQLTHNDGVNLVEKSKRKYGILVKSDIEVELGKLIYSVNQCDDDRTVDILDALTMISEWAKGLNKTESLDNVQAYNDAVTNRMCTYTVSINGETNPAYIKKFIENMRVGDAKNYRDYVESHVPGVDFKITIPIPESDGGGSFETFLVLDEYVFYSGQ